MAAVRAALERAGRPARRGARVRARDDRRDERAARGPRRAHGADRHRGLHRPRRARPPEPRAALPAVRRAARAARARRSCASARTGADDAGRSAAHAAPRTTATPRCRASRPPSPRRSRSCCCTPTATPSTSGRSARRSRERAARRARLALARGRRHVPRVRARRDDRGRRGALAAARRAICGASSERARAEGLPEPAIMQSNGGLIDLAAAADHAAWTVLSGPAGGAAGAAFVARASGRAATRSASTWAAPRATSASSTTARCRSAAPARSPDRPLALPMLAVHTVGAGGGSIAWRDPGGALRVGPALGRGRPGARPATAAAAPSRRSPTRTSCSATSAIDAPLAGGVALDRERRSAAVGALAGELGLEPMACAEGILRVANAEMVRALRVVTVERGIDPRRYALLAFGGAGPLHAAAIADELGIGTIVCPRASGVLAALGLVVSPRRRDAQRSVLLSGEELTADGDRRPRRGARRAGARGARRGRTPTLSATLRRCATAARRSSSPSAAGVGRGPSAAARGVRGDARGPLRLQRRRAGARARDDPRDRDHPGDRRRARGRGRQAARVATRGTRRGDRRRRGRGSR